METSGDTFWLCLGALRNRFWYRLPAWSPGWLVLRTYFRAFVRPVIVRIADRGNCRNDLPPPDLAEGGD